MTEQQRVAKLVEWVQSKVDCGYVYGATGWVCTKKMLEQQAAQYQEYANTILTTCTKWIGKQCFDCAQLVRKAFAELDIYFPSGATSQWKGVDWQEKGDILQAPVDKVFALYRRKSCSDTVMQHTGLHIGGGVVIDARGSKQGVMRSNLTDYPWTHYGIPKGLYDKEDDPMSENPNDLTPICTAVVVTDAGNLNFRSQPAKHASKVTGCSSIPRGATVDVIDHTAADGWDMVRYSGYIGYVDTAFLVYSSDVAAAPATIRIVDSTGNAFYPVGNFRVEIVESEG